MEAFKPLTQQRGLQIIVGRFDRMEKTRSSSRRHSQFSSKLAWLGSPPPYNICNYSSFPSHTVPKAFVSMPEGHTVHRMAQDHTKWIGGQRLSIASPQGRFEQEAVLLNGKVLKSVEAHGKHLYYAFGAKHVLHVHLGLYGKFRLHKSPPPEPRGAVRVRFVGNDHALDLNGPNQCEVLDKQGVIDSQARLGQDPLRADADPERVWARILKSKQPIGTLLLDQSIIAGIGNIYRAEILFLNRIHPSRPSKSLLRDEFDELWQTSVRLLEIGLKYNRIITVPRESTDKPLSRLNAQERLCVYKKEFCIQCAAPIDSWSLANRKMYACATCQQ